MNFDNEYKKGSIYGEEPSTYLKCLFEKTGITEGFALDIGSGTGRNSIYLAQSGLSVFALDSSREALIALRERAGRNRLAIETVVANVTEFWYPPDFFSLVVANTVLDHIQKDQAAIVAEKMANALKTDGFLFVSVFTTEDPGYTRKKPFSETAKFVKHHFYHDELRLLFPMLRVIKYHEEYMLDESHGRSHYHHVARLFAQRIRGL